MVEFMGKTGLLLTLHINISFYEVNSAIYSYSSPEKKFLFYLSILSYLFNNSQKQQLSISFIVDTRYWNTLLQSFSTKSIRWHFLKTSGAIWIVFYLKKNPYYCKCKLYSYYLWAFYTKQWQLGLYIKIYKSLYIYKD